MASEDIRELVDRCYGNVMGGILSPNALDGLYPANPNQATSSGPVPAPSPAEIIQDLVGRCYGGPVPNSPNILDSLFPTVPFVPAVVEPEPSPSEVIQNLVGRCYPGLPVIPPPPDIPEIETDAVIWDFSSIIEWIDPRVPDFPLENGKIVIKLPDPNDTSLTMTWGGSDDQCAEVVRLKVKGLLKNLNNGYWEHIQTKEQYYCPDDGSQNTDWERCVRNSLECLFRPYFGAAWTPPKADCSTHSMNGWSGNRTEICVENCFPERIPIYESKMDVAQPATVIFDSNGDLVSTGTAGTATVVLRYWWNDNPNTANTAVSNIQVSGTTITQTGRSGSVTETITINVPGTTSVTYTGLTGGFTVEDGGNRLCLKDYDGNDCNGNFKIEAALSAGDHAYDDSAAPGAGYTATSSGQAFYVLKYEIPSVTVPLFKYYSPSKTDTFLTTNPGMPDTEGAGERAMMEANGMVFREILGHVFPNATAMRSYLAPNEQAEALYRYHSPNPFDHMYSIDNMMESGFPIKIPDYFAYRIPTKPTADLNVEMDVEKGTAGYNNALGFYLADDTGPKQGICVVTTARNGTNLYRAYVSKATLEQYAGGTMGFYLIPNGASLNSLSLAQPMTFSPLNAPYSGGFSAVGISTAQNNYCLFSDKRWNPTDKDQTKWHGKQHQMWEDLIAGDDDYDDLRLWHNLTWSFGGYAYEGIQCYCYGKEAPPKVMRKIKNESPCDSRLLKHSFRDVTLRRTDCGEKMPTIQSNDVDYECAQCSGGYSISLNKEQTIAAQVGGTFRFVSMGGIAGGLFGDCMKFTLKAKKNGVDLFTNQFEAKYWPSIGQDLDANDVTITSGDTLTFEVVSIDVGPVTGDIALQVGLYDTNSTNFDSVFKLNLGTLPHDDVQGSTQGGAVANDLQDNTSNVGEITGMAMQFRPTNMGEFEWEPGCKATESWIDLSPPDPGDPYTNVWNSGPVAMHGTNQLPAVLPGETRYTNNPLMPNIPGAYIDTGYVLDQNEYFSDTILPTYKYRMLSGCYNHLLENHLVTRFETLVGEFSASNKEMLLQAAPTTFAKGSVPWYTLGEQSTPGYQAVVANLWDGWTVTPTWRDTYFSPITFIHDYTLDNFAGTGASNYVNAAKVRVGITFYPTVATFSANSRNVHYWQAVIHVIDIISPGKGYTEAAEFVCTWPPVRDPFHEDQLTTPYYPDYESQFKIPSRPVVAWFEDDDLVKRIAKEAVYQESHNKSSPVWYFTTDRNKFRVKFKIIITSVTT